jgi:hypothetical protein
MYSFIFDQTYINLLILIVIVFLVMFLWRKVIILEGNFFVLEKRVNLIKKDVREDTIAKNIEKSDIIMNEIFKDYCPINACKQSVCFPSKGGDTNCDSENSDDVGDKCHIFSKNSNDNISINEDMAQYISAISHDDLKKDPDIITCTNVSDISNDTETDIIKISDTIITSDEDYETKIITGDIDLNEIEDIDLNEPDNISVTSEITFTSDDKKYDKLLVKKYSKMHLDKLKEICKTNNISSDGTKKQLMARIIENTK